MSDNKFELHSRIWEENAKANAQWAVLSDPERLKTGFKGDEFWRSGRGKRFGQVSDS